MEARKTEDSRNELPSLTPLRGIASLWVVLYHYNVQIFPSFDSTRYSFLIEKGYLAVDMFFILSGFVLTHVYRKTFDYDFRKRYRDFLHARIARLYPLHLFVLLLFVAAAYVSASIESGSTWTFDTVRLTGPRSVVAFFANILMLQGLDAAKLSWNYPSWSISVEFLAYLALPFFLPALWRAKLLTKMGVAALLFGILGWFAYLARDYFDQWSGWLSFMRCIPEFWLGVLLYNVFWSGACAEILRRDRTSIAILLIAVVLLHFGAPDIVMIPIFAAIILTLVRNRGHVSAALNTKVFVWLGNISYSLYLVHGLIVYLTEMTMRYAFAVRDPDALPFRYAAALAACMMLICLVAATATYYGVELPSRRSLRRLLDSRRSGAAPVASAARLLTAAR